MSFILIAVELIARKYEKADNGAETVEYIHSDRLGSVSVVTNASAVEIESASYDAFGAPRLNWSNTATTAMTLTRGYTGLINMNARLYDPVLGRFMTADPTIPNVYNPQSLNRYSYVLNNPFRYTDPTGYSFEPVGGGLQYYFETGIALLDDTYYFPNGSSVNADGDWTFYDAANDAFIDIPNSPDYTGVGEDFFIANDAFSGMNPFSGGLEPSLPNESKQQITDWLSVEKNLLMSNALSADGISVDNAELNLYGMGGVQAAFHAFIAGMNISSSVYAGTDKRLCTAITTCLRLGPGFMAQIGGVYGAGFTEGEIANIEGVSFGLGGDIGAVKMTGGQITVDENGMGGVTGRGGAGAGFSFGLDLCYTSECRSIYIEE